MRFAENLSRLMEEHGLSSYSLAKKIGVTKKTVAGWLAGAEPRAAAYKLLADYFGVTVSQLKDGEAPIHSIEQSHISDTSPDTIKNAPTHGGDAASEFTRELLAAYGDEPPNLSEAGMMDMADYLRFVAEKEKRKNENSE